MAKKVFFDTLQYYQYLVIYPSSFSKCALPNETKLLVALGHVFHPNELLMGIFTEKKFQLENYKRFFFRRITSTNQSGGVNFGSSVKSQIQPTLNNGCWPGKKSQVSLEKIVTLHEKTNNFALVLNFVLKGFQRLYFDYFNRLVKQAMIKLQAYLRSIWVYLSS